MSRLEQLRAEAAELAAAARSSGATLQHCAALEAVAKRHGYENWRACRALLVDRISGSDDVEMRRYENEAWGFSLDVPVRWNSFPANPTNSPFEVIRFQSLEHGNHLLIVFREPRDPLQPTAEKMDTVEQFLAPKGFGGFSRGHLKSQPSNLPRLDFSTEMKGGPWCCRSVYFEVGTLRYVLGFGTSSRDDMIDLFDRMALSFTFAESENRPA